MLVEDVLRTMEVFCLSNRTRFSWYL